MAVAVPPHERAPQGSLTSIVRWVPSIVAFCCKEDSSTLLEETRERNLRSGNGYLFLKFTIIIINNIDLDKVGPHGASIRVVSLVVSLLSRFGFYHRQWKNYDAPKAKITKGAHRTHGCLELVDKLQPEDGFCGFLS